MRTRIKWTESLAFEGFEAPDRTGCEKSQTLTEHSTQPLPWGPEGAAFYRNPPPPCFIRTFRRAALSQRFPLSLSLSHSVSLRLHLSPYFPSLSSCSQSVPQSCVGADRTGESAVLPVCSNRRSPRGEFAPTKPWPELRSIVGFCI